MVTEQMDANQIRARYNFLKNAIIKKHQISKTNPNEELEKLEKDYDYDIKDNYNISGKLENQWNEYPKGRKY